MCIVSLIVTYLNSKFIPFILQKKTRSMRQNKAYEGRFESTNVCTFPHTVHWSKRCCNKLSLKDRNTLPPKNIQTEQK